MLEIQDAYHALATTFAQLAPLSQGELLPVSEALGRVLSQDLCCRYDHPPFAQSAMDGIAFRWSATRTTYRCVGTIAAGDRPDQGIPELEEGTCVRIMTGAPIPASADTVEMVEQLRWQDELAELAQPVQKGQHIRPRAENTRAGDLLYPAGTQVSPGLVAGLISQGQQFVQVQRRLRVGIAATGNELVGPGLALGPGQIYNSNSPSLAALLASPAIAVSDLGVLPDEAEALSAFLAGNEAFDVLILSGGVSMGKFDLVPGAAEAAGFRQVFHKVKMKPGKPIWFGSHPRGTCLFGLPGNPVSVLTGALLFVQPFLRGWSVGRFQQPLWQPFRLREPIANSGGLTFFTGVTFHSDLEGVSVSALSTSGSGDILHFSTFEGLGRIPTQTLLKRGDFMEVLLPFRGVIS